MSRGRYLFFVAFGFGILTVSKGALEHLADKRPRPSPKLLLVASNDYAQNVQRLSFGFESAIAAVHWIDLLQRARQEHFGEDTLSWEYVQLETITRLDPLFERAYVFGGVVLSVLVRDKQGALHILEKWAKQYPRYWRAHYILGYHLFFELKNYEVASRHILKAAELEGAPPWLNALGVRLLSETGALAESLRLCVDLYDQIVDPEGQDRLSLRIRSLNFKLQHRAWVAALDRFRSQNRRSPVNSAELEPWVNPPVREIASSIGGRGVVKDLAVLLTERFPFRYDVKKKTIVADLKANQLGLGEVGIFVPKE